VFANKKAKAINPETFEILKFFMEIQMILNYDPLYD